MTVAVLGPATDLPAQGAWVGAGLGGVVWGPAGVMGQCNRPGTAFGLLGRGGLRLRPAMDLLGVVGLHQFQSAPDCYTVEPLPRPSDGTYQGVGHTDLLSTRFVATDLRLRVRTPDQYQGGLAASVGVGNAWRAGRDVPYGVGALAVRLRLGPLWAALEVEAYAFAVPFEETQETWAGGELVSHAVLGRGHWSKAGAAVNLSIEVPLPGR